MATAVDPYIGAGCGPMGLILIKRYWEILEGGGVGSRSTAWRYSLTLMCPFLPFQLPRIRLFL